MAQVRVTVVCEMGEYRVEMPTDVPVQKLLMVLPGRLNLPHIDWSGEPISYGIDYSGQEITPDKTLGQVGVQDNERLTLRGVQFSSCFISYSDDDRAFAARLHSDLQSHGVTCWYFPVSATWGETVWSEIDEAVKLYDKLIVICSERSLQSAPVLREIERALQPEDREAKNIVFPVRIDNYLFEHWDHPRKADVLSKVIGDFRAWSRDDEYSEALRRILSSLQRKSRPTGPVNL
jgi:hypothetical protein